MPSPTICTVSGTVLTPAGRAISNVTVTASLTKPFVHSTDGSLIINYEVSTTANQSTGAWSLALVETATNALTMNLSFTYQVGFTNSTIRQDYAVTIPNQASASFSALVA